MAKGRHAPRSIILALLAAFPVLSGCITHREYPIYDITVVPSTDAAGARLAGEARRTEVASDLSAIDGMLGSVGFQALPSDRWAGTGG